MLTPLDIQSVTFNRSMRGYNEREVDDFLDRLVIEYEQIYKENLALKEKLAAATAQPAHGPEPGEVDGTVQRIIAMAEETARETRANAEQAAALIIEQAKAQGEKAARTAREDVQTELTRLEEVRKQAQLFHIQFKTLLETYLQLLDSTAETAAGATGATGSTGTPGAINAARDSYAGLALRREPVASPVTPGEKRALLDKIMPVAEGLKQAAAGLEVTSKLDAAGLKAAGLGATKADTAGQATPDFDDDEQTPTWMEVKK